MHRYIALKVSIGTTSINSVTTFTSVQLNRPSYQSHESEQKARSRASATHLSHDRVNDVRGMSYEYFS